VVYSIINYWILKFYVQLNLGALNSDVSNTMDGSVFFVTRLIIIKINKVQWVDFKLENVLVSLHSLPTMGLGNGELLGHSPIRNLTFITPCSKHIQRNIHLSIKLPCSSLANYWILKFYVQLNLGALNSDVSNTMDGSNWFESPVNFPYISKEKNSFRSNTDTSNSRTQ
jgi:hypothetical protein